MTRNVIFITLALLMIAVFCTPVMAWGPDAHIKEADAAAPYAGIASLNTFESASTDPDSCLVCMGDLASTVSLLELPVGQTIWLFKQ
jgi:hypothetical protein